MDTDAPWPQRAPGAPPPGAGEEPTREGRARRGFGSILFLLDAARRRRGGRIALWSIVVALGLGGTWLVAYPFITNVWAERIQNGLEQDFAAMEANVEPGAQGFTTANKPTEGKALTRLRIPKLNVNVIVVEGTSGNALRAGAGHFEDTPLPGEAGNVAIAGHRTGYGEPFRHVDRLKAGDQVILDTPFASHIYEVMPPFDGHPNPWVVPPTDVSVKMTTATPVVTLITCDPPGTSETRLIVRAQLVASKARA